MAGTGAGAAGRVRIGVVLALGGGATGALAVHYLRRGRATGSSRTRSRLRSRGCCHMRRGGWMRGRCRMSSRGGLGSGRRVCRWSGMRGRGRVCGRRGVRSRRRLGRRVRGGGMRARGGMRRRARLRRGEGYCRCADHQAGKKSDGGFCVFHECPPEGRGVAIVAASEPRHSLRRIRPLAAVLQSQVVSWMCARLPPAGLAIPASPLNKAAWMPATLSRGTRPVS